METIQSNEELFSSLGFSATPQEPVDQGLEMEDFMNLMVTELTHQDPFKPMENTELATQISQFAAVSGIDDLNKSFTGLSSSITSDQALQAANLLGRQVLVPSSAGWFGSGDTLKGSIELPSNASNVTLRITNSNGALVRELELGSHEGGALAFSWDGYDDQGDFAGSGLYQVTAQATVDGAEMAPAVHVAAEVESVSLGGSGGVRLNLVGLGQVSMNDVKEIY
ncbi:flagellar hook assembly protein FlgD [Candidatus Endoriftia persephonae]|jgi:flagellar basal-body rod modification protein FlgD|uniref:Basal-body rod modification protein FlgD n=2 Tax=Gammaproteobacteria TaxID=1236 RepID=G2FB41_9GAMM|nr:flagellar hook assembly protein FlgD [Candidatus Endoriftia persephone]EGW55979.1 basal-body rod modification protein FlgD [endosymbiont of Tevnia jerichonana (vent Tica)]USF88111.1 flagellar hook assembly protein FlgD [Candidatus Endoriftia persephone]